MDQTAVTLIVGIGSPAVMAVFSLGAMFRSQKYLDSVSSRQDAFNQTQMQINRNLEILITKVEGRLDGHEQTCDVRHGSHERRFRELEHHTQGA